MKRVLQVSAVAVAAVVSAFAFDNTLFRNTISESAARQLVSRAIAALGKAVPETIVEPLTIYWSPEFYNYQAWLPQSDDKPLLTFFFAVNPWNGEIWDTKNCRRITSPSIEQEQKAIWRRSGLPEEARDPLHHKVPGECVGLAK